MVKYHIKNDHGDIYGPVNVSPAEEADLLKCRHGSAPAARTAASAHGRAVNAISAALRRGPRLSKQGVRRGC